MNGYKTVEEESVAEFTEKKSRFIGYACPVKTEDEALAFVNKIKKKHADARHNVYAYVVRENNVQRFSDDGEPQGTAGIPVLDTIRKQELTDIALVVTRYFGGILLGGGGLVRAYGHAASIAIDAAKPIYMSYSAIYRVKVSYTLWGKVEYEMRKMELSPYDMVYDSDVYFSVSVLLENVEKFEKNLTEATGGQAEFSKFDEKFVATEIKEEF
ncbi:MAG: YigZ family protein [Clostridia bacterium]|nr:YigZ family protein [Clostridia bacterium]